MATAAVVLVSIFLFFLFTARSLTVQVQTETSAKVRINGFSVPFGERYLIRPGDYDITVTAKGYAPYTDQFTVTKEDSQQLQITPTPLPGMVSFVIEPPDARIQLDEQLVETDASEGLVLEAGEYTLAVSAPRYQDHLETLVVTGREVSQTVAIALTPNWAMFTVEVTPVADLSVDGQPLGKSSEPFELLAGTQELVFSAPGYQSVTRTLTVIPQQDQVLPPVNLLPADGEIAISSSPDGANVTVDGEFVGRTPLQISLPPDKAHTVLISKAGYERGRLSLRVEQGQRAEKHVTLTPKLGTITVSVTPQDAEVWVNGNLVGRGSQSLSLPAVEHRLAFRLAGYATEQTRVTPRPGLAQNLAVTLLTEAEARKAALKPELITPLGQELVLIDPINEVANEFTMGASRRDPGRRSNEVEHTVRLERAFYIAKTETTNAQFRQFLASHDSGQIEGNSLNREHQPAVGMSWQQAARFCNWLSAKEGLPPFYREQEGIIVGYNASATGYRLPTEAEWAFVARVAGDKRYRFSWGDTFPPKEKTENFADNTSAFVTGRILNGYADGHIVSAPVGSFPPNHRGLFDINGNVAEWVHDVYQIPSPNSDIQTDPLGPLSGDNYTVRGASWALSRLSELRLTYRDYGQSGRDDLGFRIARYAE
jgi:formylglycine-generating enzyme required for sulfatase activity